METTTLENPEKPIESTDLFDFFAFETVKAGEKWEANFSHEQGNEYPWSLYRIDGDDPVYVACASTVEGLCSLVRDDYCNDAENLKADLADGEFEKLVAWAESWEATLESNA
jgi:hypothetical protein